jgi:hypothetical protein
LGICEEYHHSFPVVAAEDAQILTDALFSPTFGFGLGHAADEHEFRA